MKKENEATSKNDRLLQLISEVEGNPTKEGSTRARGKDISNAISLFWRWSIFGLLCLGIGFWAGSYNTRTSTNPQRRSETESLKAQGWRNDGTGVYYRWCKESCNAPRIYGGGAAQVFEVKCIDRPCGSITMRFNALDRKGEVIDQQLIRETGMQGETRRFLVESQNPSAASFELSEFAARARVL